MRLLDFGLVATACGSLVQANPTGRHSKPPNLFLIGDSTVAVDGGWGNGLLSYLKDPPARGENRGLSGATTVTWKLDGRWEKLIGDIHSIKADYEPIVTVQFGHNDQKVMSSEEFKSNMVNITNDIRAAGGTPILITSLTRRNFGDDGKVKQDHTQWGNLAQYAAATIAAAEEAGVKFLDLNKASEAYVNAIGEENSVNYDWGPGDATHLNPAGEIVFGRMTLDLLLKARGDLRGYFTSNKELSRKIAAGEFATGDE
ncbi:probable acetylesterase [Cephalotrichum gorgonifer]|uniref:Probable acetylesterase n=1 Tax=Cephalotrichum gorgonifer TaxID=2041049 RepID=A0AAE8MVS0_9PEZI|nr:probable acetylesterase [Cephalotrichum gorgonifer]